MSALEFTAHAGKVFNVQLYTGITNDPDGGVVAAVEGVPGRYRVTVPQTNGIYYVVATATNLLVSGYANLSRPGANGYSELLATYDEAYALGSDTPPPIDDIQPADVRAGVVYLDSDGNSQTGTLSLPAEHQVLLGIGYGTNSTELVGTLIALSDSSEAYPGNMLSNGQIRSPLSIGGHYASAYGMGFSWRVQAPSGLVPADVIMHFRGRKFCSPDDTYAWDSAAESVTAAVVDGVTYWDLVFDLTDAQTSLLTEGTYRWWVVAEAVGGDIILKRFSVYNPLKFQRG